MLPRRLIIYNSETRRLDVLIKRNFISLEKCMNDTPPFIRMYVCICAHADVHVFAYVATWGRLHGDNIILWPLEVVKIPATRLLRLSVYLPFLPSSSSSVESTCSHTRAHVRLPSLSSRRPRRSIVSFINQVRGELRKRAKCGEMHAAPVANPRYFGDGRGREKRTSNSRCETNR